MASSNAGRRGKSYFELAEGVCVKLGDRGVSPTQGLESVALVVVTNQAANRVACELGDAAARIANRAKQSGRCVVHARLAARRRGQASQVARVVCQQRRRLAEGSDHFGGFSEVVAKDLCAVAVAVGDGVDEAVVSVFEAERDRAGQRVERSDVSAGAVKDVQLAAVGSRHDELFVPDVLTRGSLPKMYLPDVKRTGHIAQIEGAGGRFE